MADVKPETIYKPKYNGSMRFAVYLYPLWLILFGYFLYQSIAARSYNPQGFLAVVFGMMVFSLPFRVFREVRFGDRITVKRYFLPDLIIEYRDIVTIDRLSLSAPKKGISLYMLNYDSREEFDAIIHNLMSTKKIRLKKK
jgi:hypothetical protein